MMFAEVAVNSPFARRQAFSYSVPAGLDIVVGQGVWVPFGEKVLQGIVMEVAPIPSFPETRDIAGLIEPQPLLSLAHVALARWLSDYYLSPLFAAVALMLPPGFERKPVTFVSATLKVEDSNTIPAGLAEALDVLRKQGKTSLKELEKKWGKKKASTLVSQLLGQGFLVRSYEMGPLKVKPKYELRLSLAVKPDAALAAAAGLSGKATKQAALLEYLARQAGPVSWQAAMRETGATRPIANALAGRGLVAFQPVAVRREPISYEDIKLSKPLKLSSAQNAALQSITAALASQKKESPAVFLLHGVTASGKTEVYLQALAEAVRRGKQGIVLVPEIALTPQTIERFAARFPHRVAILHSHLSLGEQFDEWQSIRQGEFDVVIGPRSALFAPQPDLGLIIIDEEHEWAYKQTEQAPRYHARAAALKLAELTGAVVILGSATPDVETYYRTRTGEIRLLELPERVTPGEGSPLPRVEVVDLREELKAGNRGIFSRDLSAAMTEALRNTEQIILFLNRRGGATFVQCRKCGFVLRCKRCEVALTQHYADDALVCHQCNYHKPVPQTCPRCFSRQIKFLGLGTEKLEQETGRAFPGARLLRWDSDVTGGKDAHAKILGKLRRRQADILIGTQMIAKGLDLPAVTLVGVVSADISLNLPHFRAGERTFQLLSQVAGRAGRGEKEGQVIIQTYSPEHYAVQAAARHDYAAFYEKEIAFRRSFFEPPFRQFALLTYTHYDEARCQREAGRMSEVLTAEIEAKGIADLGLIGPAPAFVHRLRGRSRWQLILRGTELSSFLAAVAFPQGWIIDIDPASLI